MKKHQVWRELRALGAPPLLLRLVSASPTSQFPLLRRPLASIGFLSVSLVDSSSPISPLACFVLITSSNPSSTIASLPLNPPPSSSPLPFPSMVPPLPMNPSFLTPISTKICLQTLSHPPTPVSPLIELTARVGAPRSPARNRNAS